MSQGKMSVTIKILILFLLIAIITLGFSVFIGFPLIEEIGQKASVSSIDLGEKAVEDSSQALLESAERELLSLAQDKAELSNYYFTRSEDNLEYLAEASKQLMTMPASGSGHVYGNDTPPADPNGSSLLHTAPNASPGSDEEIRYLGDMEQYLLPLYGTNTDLDSVYIGTKSGYILVHPWTNSLPATYDPRLRPWYIETSGNGGITWIGPYIDSSSNTLMMTGAIPVRSDARNISWVIGLDLKVDTINQIINSTDSGGEGYAILIDKTGDIISKPGLSTNDTRWDEIYSAENLLESDNPTIVSAARNMTGGKTGVERVSMAEGENIIAYAPIPSTGWSIGIVRPLSSILAPVIKTEAEIRNATEKTATTISDNKQTVLSMYLAGSLILLFFISLLAFVFARYITRPIGVLMDATRVIGSGDLSKEVNLHTGDEFEELGSLFNRMSQNLVQVMKTLEKTTAEKERYATELDIAKDIQQSFLPETIPEVTGLDISARSLMAREVGGDFFDIFPFEVVKINKTRIILMIADVSGKGVPAALFMALARIVIRVHAYWFDKPSDVINAANQIISQESRSGMFVTTFYADYEEKTRKLRYVNAGHNPPMLLRDNNLTTMEGNDIAIGVMPDYEYSEGYVDLQPGDLLAFYTDGVTEAVDTDLELFGESRLVDLLKMNSHRTAQEILDAVYQAVENFAQGRPQEDDITLIIIKVL